MDKKYKRSKVIRKGFGKQGFFDETWQCHDVSTNEIVVVRRIIIFDGNNCIPSSVLLKTFQLKELRHENIVRLLDLDHVVTGHKGQIDHLDLVYESVGVNLKKFIITSPEKMKDPHVIKRLLHQILRGVAYCHSCDIFYEDLNPENILIDHHNNAVKLADVGLAKAVDRPCDIIPLGADTSKVTNHWYMAPEIWNNMPEISNSVDMWSVGCIFSEMVNQQPLFHCNSQVENIFSFIRVLGTPISDEILPGASRILKPQRPKDLAEVVPGLEPAGVDLLSKMLCWDPRQRITAHSALEHAYFNDVETKTTKREVLSESSGRESLFYL